MAALYALGVDNAVIEVDGAEMPVMDGSSAMFVDAMEQAGIRALMKKRRYIRVRKQVRVDVGASFMLDQWLMRVLPPTKLQRNSAKSIPACSITK